MGCGISKIDPEEAGGRPKRSHKRNSNHVHANHKTIEVEEADDFVNDHHMHGARKSVSSSPIFPLNNKGNDSNNNGNGHGKGGHSKESSFDDGEDVIGYSASPSFREYCVDSDSSNDGNGGKEENSSQGERASNVEKVHIVEQERSLIYEKAPGSRSRESHMRSTRNGYRSAMQKPAGWIGKSKK